jgi:hypothetical protein
MAAPVMAALITAAPKPIALMPRLVLGLNDQFTISVPDAAVQRIAAGVCRGNAVTSCIVSRPFLPSPVLVAGVSADHEFTIALGDVTAAAALGILRLLNI